MRNALVLGGTGMLQGLSLQLVAEGWRVFVVGRDAKKFLRLQDAVGEMAPHLTCMALDYHALDRLGRWVAHLQLMDGPLDLVVGWIHGDAGPVLETVDREVAAYRQSAWDLYHVLPIRAAVDPPFRPSLSPSCRYHRIILGYQKEGHTTRWLTPQEISAGVAEAVFSGDDGIVGRVDPYDRRPDSSS